MEVLHDHVTTAMFGGRIMHGIDSTPTFYISISTPMQPKTFITQLGFLYLPQRDLSVD